MNEVSAKYPALDTELGDMRISEGRSPRPRAITTGGMYPHKNHGSMAVKATVVEDHCQLG